MSTETPVKPWWQSLAVWGGILTVLSGLGLTGIQIDVETGDFHGNVYALCASVMNLLTGVAAVYGRVRAVTRIGRGT